MTGYARFFGPPGATVDQGNASRSLTLGGVLYVNSGQLGVNDVLNKTYSIRMGSVITMNTMAGTNAIAIGSAQSSAADALKASLATKATGARAIAIGAKASADGTDTVALGLEQRRVRVLLRLLLVLMPRQSMVLLRLVGVRWLQYQMERWHWD